MTFYCNYNKNQGLSCDLQNTHDVIPTMPQPHQNHMLHAPFAWSASPWNLHTSGILSHHSVHLKCYLLRQTSPEDSILNKNKLCTIFSSKYSLEHALLYALIFNWFNIYHYLYQRHAFTAVTDGQINLTPNETAMRAARDAINGWDPSGGAIYYYNPVVATSSWIFDRQTVTVIGKHVFAI